VAGRGIFQEGCGGTSPATPTGLGMRDRMDWGRGWTPQHGTIPCGSTAVGRDAISAHITPPVLMTPPARPTSDTPPTPAHPMLQREAGG